MRIAIVDDMPLARRALKRVVQSVPSYAIAWQACDGAEAVRLAKVDPPDVILMDLIMPRLNGAEAVRQIMAHSPCPIIIVTASVREQFPLVIEAMSHGALDAVETPVLSDGQVRDGEPLLARLARIEQSLSQPEAPARVPELPLTSTTRCDRGLLALGASTGGPAALATLLSALPANFPVPVVVIQHMKAEFIPELVTWLRGRCQLVVETAIEGHLPRPGVVSVAMTDDHLVLCRGGKFAVVREPATNPFRPSVDVFFASLLTHAAVGVAVLLSGMGSDGAAGMLALRRGGWHTIAQDEASSVVYGMPRAAVELRAAVRVLPLTQIAAEIQLCFDRAG